MTLQQIHYALVAAETGSMNRAAAKLFISQPTLTGAIKELEKETGITIFHRSTRGISTTLEGEEFLRNARQLYRQYELLEDKYGPKGNIKHKFCVSSQHYTFVVKAFADTVNTYGTSRYEFELKETRTLQVIRDVADGFSEIGVLYRSEYNRRYLSRLFERYDLAFVPLISCDAYVYLYKDHPLAKKKSIDFEELQDYPYLSFDQGENSAYYLAEEILAENVYPRMVKISDRATALNLMRAINGYMLCSGIIDTSLNGSDYVVIPYEPDRDNPNSVMEIGWIARNHTIRSSVGQTMIRAMKAYFSNSKKL